MLGAYREKTELHNFQLYQVDKHFFDSDEAVVYSPKNENLAAAGTIFKLDNNYLFCFFA